MTTRATRYALTAAVSGLLTGVLLVGERQGAVVGALGGLVFGAPPSAGDALRVTARYEFRHARLQDVLCGLPGDPGPAEQIERCP